MTALGAGGKKPAPIFFCPNWLVCQSIAKAGGSTRMARTAFDQLRILNKRQLRECTLSHLGKVNVVCGRNSSGKSTLLEGIADSSTRFPGTLFGPEDVEAIYQKLERSAGWRQAQSGESVILRRLVSGVLAKPRNFFLNESAVLSNEIEEAYKSSPLRQWAFSTMGVGQHFVEKLPNDARAVLIPPKRQLETICPLNTGTTVQPSGSGIVNFLFFAKNQPRSSTQWATQEEMAHAFTDISKGFVFDTFLNMSNTLDLRFSKSGRQWVAAGESGLGLQDLLILLYYAVSPDYDLVCAEEPESHMHPEMQRRLLGFLRGRENKQFFLTTHSNVFLDNAFVDRVFFTTFADEMVNVSDATSRASMLDDLGYSVADNLVSDVVVLVEGPTDGPIVEEFLLKFGVVPRFSVKVWPLGGDIMDQLDLTVLAQGNKLIALIDQDPGSSRVRERFTKGCEKLRIPVHRLERYSIENYLTVPAIRAVFPEQVPASLEVLDADQAVEKQLGFSVKRNSRKVAKAMTLADIQGTDFEAFLSDIRKLCDAGQS